MSTKGGLKPDSFSFICGLLVICRRIHTLTPRWAIVRNAGPAYCSAKPEAVSAHFISEQILPSGYAQNYNVCFADRYTKPPEVCNHFLPPCHHFLVRAALPRNSYVAQGYMLDMDRKKWSNFYKVKNPVYPMVAYAEFMSDLSARLFCCPLTPMVNKSTGTSWFVVWNSECSDLQPKSLAITVRENGKYCDKKSIELIYTLGKPFCSCKLSVRDSWWF